MHFQHKVFHSTGVGHVKGHGVPTSLRPNRRCDRFRRGEDWSWEWVGLAGCQEIVEKNAAGPTQEKCINLPKLLFWGGLVSSLKSNK